MFTVGLRCTCVLISKHIVHLSWWLSALYRFRVKMYCAWLVQLERQKNLLNSAFCEESFRNFALIFKWNLKNCFFSLGFVHFRLHSLSVLRSEYHECSAGGTSVCLRRALRGYFRSECCTGAESTAASPANRFFAPTQSTKRDRLPLCFSRLRYNPTGNRTQPASFGGARCNNCTARPVFLFFLFV